MTIIQSTIWRLQERKKVERLWARSLAVANHDHSIVSRFGHFNISRYMLSHRAISQGGLQNLFIACSISVQTQNVTPVSTPNLTILVAIAIN